MQSDLISEQPFSYLHVVRFVRGDWASSDSLIQRGVCPRSSGGTDGCVVCPRDPAELVVFFESFSLRRTEPICDPTAQQINPGRRPDHNLDRNGVDDGTVAIGAIDTPELLGIHARDGSSGTDHPNSNRAGIIGSPDQRKL
jgi:hypothetical protein